MITPKHPGSRVVDQPPNLGKVIRRIESEVTRLARRARPETLTFTDATASRGTPATSATMANTLVVLAYRSGDSLYADVLCSTGASSVLEVQLAAPDLPATGPAVQTTAGGDQIIRVTLDMPDTWQGGQARLVYLQARRVSGTDSTTVRVVRAWQY